MAGRVVLPDPAHGARRNPLQQQLRDVFAHELVHPLHRRPLVSPVERPEELPAVPPFRRQVRRHRPRHRGDLAGPPFPGQLRQPQPQVCLDHVGGHDGSLHVEHREHQAVFPRSNPDLWFGARRRREPQRHRDRRAVHLLQVMRPVDLLTKRARDPHHPRVVERVLVDRHQHRDQHVFQRHHRGGDRHHSDLLGALEDLVGHVQPGGPEDDVDHDLIKPGLVEPLLGWTLGPHPDACQGKERRVGVLRLDHHVEVVLRLRPSARPRGEAAAEHEGDTAIAERGNRLLQRLCQCLERLSVTNAGVHRPMEIPRSG